MDKMGKNFSDGFAYSLNEMFSNSAFYTYDKILLVEQLLLIYKLQETRNKF